ncbi:eukaryotic translation initiation factor 3 subunit A [Chytriomyces hyalinus]|nr:eukaryotic translation initiation factor 3 subunit A [Chytriomyces hyalinus]
MSRMYQRPENALKRAEELIAVSQHESALDLLHEVIMSKRTRATSIAVLEPILLRFIELAVIMRKGKVAKEGLHQYKNISQNVTVTAIELVIKKFIDLSEAKVAEAQTKADKINLDNVDDLEATETPESIILSTVSGDVSKDRTDREVVTPWLKFLWEAYRTALDILRNNSRLEILYQTMASQAFKFCLKYTRKTEFRRLCEILRQHLTTSAKYAHQTHSINLSDPETLQRHLDTRFEQLNAAAELELWQEGFRSIEDIHTLFVVSKKPPKAYMQAQYYEKLARIFSVGENYLFHAAAVSKYFSIAKMNKNMPEEEQERWATLVMMSALSIPIIAASKTRTTTADTDDNKPRDQRLTNLLRVSKIPTRESLLKEALNKAVFARVRPEVRELYTILEVDFHPLSISKKIAPLIQKLSSHKEFSKYSRPLHQVILTRLLQQLSQVYQSITIESIVQLASFPSLSATNSVNFDEGTIEKFIMNGCRKGELNIRVNHMTRTITFETDVFAGSKATGSKGPRVQSTPAEQMRTHLTNLANRLNTAVTLISPHKLQEKREAQQEAFRAALEAMEEERRLAAERVILIEKRREIKEYEAAKKIREDEIKRIEQARKEAEAEKVRMEEEVRRREMEKIAQIRAEREREEAMKLAERIAGDGKNKNIKDELMNLDTKTLMDKQLELLEQEKRDLANKMRQISKRLDHTERAMRRAETPKWEADHVEQKRIDKAYHNALAAAQQEATKTKHASDLKVKARVTRILPDFLAHKAKLDAVRQADYEAKVARAQALIAEAKAQRITEFRKKKAEEAARARKEEEARRLRAEEERIRLEEGQRLSAEKAARDAARKAEEAERTKKLDETYQRQQERERAAEERVKQRERERLEERARQQQQQQEPASRGSEGPWARGARPQHVSAAATPADSGDTWRPKNASSTPSESSSTGPISSTGKYIPPSRRGGAEPQRSAEGGRPAAFGAFGGSRNEDRRGGDDRFGASRPNAFGARRDGDVNRGGDAPPPQQAPAGGGWRDREAARSGSGAGAAPSSGGSGKYVLPGRRGN